MGERRQSRVKVITENDGDENLCKRFVRTGMPLVLLTKQRVSFIACIRDHVITFNSPQKWLQARLSETRQ